LFLQKSIRARELVLIVLAMDASETYRRLNSAIDSSVTRTPLRLGLALSNSSSTKLRIEPGSHSNSRAASASVLAGEFGQIVDRDDPAVQMPEPIHTFAIPITTRDHSGFGALLAVSR